MRIYKYLLMLSLILTLWLCAWSPMLQADALPVLFARSGQRAAISVDGKGKDVKNVVLRAFGQPWGEPTVVKDGIADVMSPKVRVPVTFRVTPASADIALAELVVYPDVPVRWEKKDVQLVQVGAPEWFNTWSAAVGLPVQKMESMKQFTAGNWRMLEKSGLLIVGPKVIADDFGTVSRLAVDHSTNVFVLEDDWFRVNRSPCTVTVLPKHLAGPLADMQTEHWALPPAFSANATRIANRQSWISGPDHPWVEEIRSPRKGSEAFRTVVSYLPWQNQLGRSEIADALFLRLLRETVDGAKDRPALDRRWCLVYPSLKDVAACERPILAAAARALDDAESREVCAYVVDLRGDKPIPVDFFKESDVVRKVETRIGPETPLLILGDNAALDGWKWLAADRVQHHSPRPGVLWWCDGALPSSLNERLQLMQFFTDRNISLGDILQE